MIIKLVFASFLAMAIFFSFVFVILFAISVSINGSEKSVRCTVICFSIALICIVASVFFNDLYQKDYENTYQKTSKATIVSVETKTGWIYEVRYSFTADDGVTYRGKNMVETEPEASVITIRYNPKDPTENDIP